MILKIVLVREVITTIMPQKRSSYSCMFIHYGQMDCINILSRVKDFLYHGYNNDGGYDIAFYRHGYEQAPNVRRYKSGKQQANSS